MNSVIVKLWDNEVGFIYEIDGVIYFKYDEKFINGGIEISPIVMPLSSNIYCFNSLNKKTFFNLPGIFRDSLPDKFGNRVMDKWLNKKNINPKIIEKLCYIGTSGMGALEFIPSFSDENSINVDINKMVNICNKLLFEEENNLIDKIENLARIGIFAGGARVKAIVAYNKEKDLFKSGQVDAGPEYEHYIIKFDGIENNKDKESADKSYFTRVEYAYYLMAKKAGIEMSDTMLYIKNGKYHFLTKRFDRYIDNDGKMAKLHMQTLGGIAHEDFNIARSFSYEQASVVMKKIGLSDNEIAKLFRLMVFNVMARNQDDHVKNISFLMDKKGAWKLAPAYDVTFAYDKNGKWTSEHQMLINGKSANITYEDLLCAGKTMNLKESKCKLIINEVKDAINQFEIFAKQAYLDDDVIQLIKREFIIL